MKTLLALPLALLVAIPAAASADSGPPDSYSAFENPAGRVTIFLSGSDRACPDQGLLRRDTVTGEIVRITTCDGGSFVDECVPAGHYQYGLQVPYACGFFGSAFFTTIDVTGPRCAEASCSCTRTVAAPEAGIAAVPWGSDPMVCRGAYFDDHSSSGCATGGAVLATNFVLLLAGGALWRWRRARRPA